MLKELTLTNFKKHTNLSIPFPNGLTSITGDNAAGKSTILKGVLFALFGAAAVGAKEHIWTWGSKEKRQVALKITLPEYGDVLVSRTPSGASITTMEGSNLASGNTAVTKFIEEALGMLAKDLKTLCYSPQGETQNILTMGPTALQQKIEGLARVDVLDRVLGLVSNDLLKLEGRLEGIPLDLDVIGLEGKLQLLQENKARRDADMQLSVKMQEMLAQERVGLVANMSEALRYQQKRQTLTTDIQRLTSAIQVVEVQIDELEARSKLLSQEVSADIIDQLNTQYINTRQQYEAGLQHYTTLQSTSAERQQCLTGIAAWGLKAEAHEDADRKLGKITAEAYQAKSAAQEAEELWRVSREEQELQTKLLHDATCPTCKRDMEGVDRGLIAEELAKWTDSANTNKALYHQRIAEWRDLQTQEDNLRQGLNPEASIHLLNCSARLAELPEDIDQQIVDAKGKVDSWVTEVNQLVSRINAANIATATLKEVDAQITALINQRGQSVTQLELSRDALRDTPEADITTLQEALNTCEAKLNTTSQQIQDYRLEVSRYDSQIDTVTSALANAKQLEVERQALTQKSTHLGQFQKHLKTNRSRWAEDIWGGLLHYASALISNTTGGVLSNLTRSPKGEFLVNELDRVVPVDESSGFQKSLVGMALRVALSKVFYGDNLFLLLDEATSDANDANAAAVAGMLSSLNMQVVMVSHRAGADANATNLVELK